MRRFLPVLALTLAVAGTLSLSHSQISSLISLDNGVAAPANANLVQITSNKNTAMNTISKAFTSNNTAGNTLVIVASYQNAVFGVGVASISDTQGNTYTAIQNLGDGINHFLSNSWVVKNCAAGANTVNYSNAITAHATNSLSIVIAEYSGMGATPVINNNQVYSSMIGPVVVSVNNHAGVSQTVTDSTVTSNNTIFGLIDIFGNATEVLVFYESDVITVTRVVSLAPTGVLTVRQNALVTSSNTRFWDH